MQNARKEAKIELYEKVWAGEGASMMLVWKVVEENFRPWTTELTSKIIVCLQNIPMLTNQLFLNCLHTILAPTSLLDMQMSKSHLIFCYEEQRSGQYNLRIIHVQTVLLF